jgi:hypothetical protein
MLLLTRPPGPDRWLVSVVMAHVYTRTQDIKWVVRAVETVVNWVNSLLVQGSIRIIVGRLFSILSLSDDANPAIVETLKTLGCSLSQI